MNTDFLRRPWASLSMLAIAITAIGLSIAALIIALDDDTPPGLNHDGGSLAGLVGPADRTPDLDTNLDRLEEKDAAAPARRQPPAPVAAVARAATEAVTTAADLLNGARPLLGLLAQRVDDLLVVRAVLPGSPADLAGIQRVDHLLSINDAPVLSLPEVHDILSALESGDTVRIGIERDGAPQTVEVELRAFDPGDAFTRPDGARPDFRGSAPTLGLRVESSDDGLTVTGVMPGSGADADGLAEGDLLRAINGAPAPDTEAVRAALREIEPGATVTLTVERDGATLDLAVAVGEGLRSLPGPGFARPNSGDDEGRRGPFGRVGIPFSGFGGSFDSSDLFADGEFRVLIGAITALSSSEISVSGGTAVTITEDTRQAGELNVGDRVFVVARDGVARLIVPAPDFAAFTGPPGDA